jgi:lysozyme
VSVQGLTKQLTGSQRKEEAARRAWLRAAEKFPKGDPRLRQAQKAFEAAKAARKKLDARVAAAQKASSMSARGRGFLIAAEGFIPYAYNDSRGHATFGVGHLLHFGPVTAADRAKWGTKANPKPRALVDRTLQEDLANRFEPVVRKTIRRPLKQHQFDALVAFAFNIGTKGFSDSTAAQLINKGDFRGAGDAMLNWRRPPEIIPRRRRERELFLSGKYL